MKKTKSKFLTTGILIALITLSAKAQTNVSGGIYTNTTWTLANSPYIVVDTVVVFPGVTLTIEPGTIIKFASNKRLEIRQSYLIAEGTVTDSITFTSNAAFPTAGAWEEIWLNSSHSCKFNHCNFRYSNNGLRNTTSNFDTLFIKNSKFEFNNNGISNFSSSPAIGYCKLDSSNFDYNTNYGFNSINAGVHGRLF